MRSRARVRFDRTRRIDVADGRWAGDRLESNYALYRLHDLVPSGIAGTTHYLGARTDREKANYFVEHVGTGENLPRNSPILRFRDLMMRDRRNKRDPLRELEKWALAIKAMNAFFLGAEVKLLVWRPGAREGFPRVLERIPAPQPALAADIREPQLATE